ncbi:MAG: undecaprenyl-diphosphate phosphatase, partial [Clostridia bacterium]|nr:undecaprenyl-diphosphate phosphatase [Clostridia bacterium]
MSVLEGLLYGLLQGLTEFLPVSSSGHLALAQNIFGAKDMESNYLTFTVLLHLGTLAAVVFVYRKDVWLMIKGFF